MTFTGNLAEFSLPEIFQLLEQGNNTGLLTIRTFTADLTAVVPVHYIWLYQGRIVAAADCLDEKGLVSMIAQRGWVSEEVALKMAQLCRVNTPIGLCLKFQGLLQAEQLKLLFRTQVVEQVSALFELKNGQFEFDAQANLPLAEMTGISMPATEVTLIGLRTLRDWSMLAEKLPDLTLILSNKNTSQSQLQLDSVEWQVWQLADGTISLGEIANQLGIAIEEVQQIAFRLLMSHLAEEIFLTAVWENQMIEATSVAENLPKLAVNSPSQSDNTQELTHTVVETTSIAESLPDSAVDSPSQTNVDQSFLQKLVGWLRVIRSFF
ncbi:DUF4388 domain-containing protein [Brasilonema sp. UFV-L1]|uniref:DUF4388 domain-containing protein n=1 Tax=Brasilonema sp. UFV-L1 TaxID=2234130 RepID=UPI00145D3620|nr:DUF4388 domain-containing protein [Brasilonema sp. UFV-L1]NMG06124.1 hypothetical protein [Brasilonema sp. UFV-L1]